MDTRDFNDLSGNVRGAIAQVRGAQENIDELERALADARQEKAEALAELERARVALFSAYPELAPEPAAPPAPNFETFVDESDQPPPEPGAAPGGFEFRESSQFG